MHGRKKGMWSKFKDITMLEKWRIKAGRVQRNLCLHCVASQLCCAYIFPLILRHVFVATKKNKYQCLRDQLKFSTHRCCLHEVSQVVIELNT